MSKVFKGIFTLFLVFQYFNSTEGQTVSAEIQLNLADRSALISGSLASSGERSDDLNLVFAKSYAGIGKLGERVTGLKLIDPDGVDVPYRQLIPGEILASRRFVKWQYKLDLAPRSSPSSSAHISWVGEQAALLYLSDTLPQYSFKGKKVRADIRLAIPPGWKAYPDPTPDGQFVFDDADKASIVVGRDLRVETVKTRDSQIELVLGGEWQFSNEDAAAQVREIFESFVRLFGTPATDRSRISLLKFPVPAGPGVWEANTLGSSVIVLSSDTAFKSQALQRLHEQLRHEIFHLWVPNAVELTGNYDWFYEGFALYTSLKTAVLLNRIRFEDFLDTLSRAYTIDKLQRPRMSLIEASQKRWSGGNTAVYARGMIVAFLCDIELLAHSKGKVSTNDVLQETFDRYRNGNPFADGNTAVIEILNSHAELKPIVEKYIAGSTEVDLAQTIALAGLLSDERNSSLTLKTVEKPNGRQKAILDRLGYNAWRKVGSDSK